jgi:hypothetical protein
MHLRIQNGSGIETELGVGVELSRVRAVCLSGHLLLRTATHLAVSPSCGALFLLHHHTQVSIFHKDTTPSIGPVQGQTAPCG